MTESRRRGVKVKTSRVDDAPRVFEAVFGAYIGLLVRIFRAGDEEQSCFEVLTKSGGLRLEHAGNARGKDAEGLIPVPFIKMGSWAA